MGRQCCSALENFKGAVEEAGHYAGEHAKEVAFITKRLLKQDKMDPKF